MKNEIIIYQSQELATKVEVKIADDTIWLTQTQIIVLFNSSKANISEHIKHIFQSGELHSKSTVRKIRTVQSEGNREVARELTHFTKRKERVSFTIITKKISKQFALDLKKHNEQYPEVNVHEFQDAHDRFLIIDNKEVYHFGASLKDLGKKWFAFSKMDISSVKILDKIKFLTHNL